MGSEADIGNRIGKLDATGYTCCPIIGQILDVGESKIGIETKSQVKKLAARATVCCDWVDFTNRTGRGSEGCKTDTRAYGGGTLGFPARGMTSRRYWVQSGAFDPRAHLFWALRRWFLAEDAAGV
jgi:hypothetical protein